MIRAALFGSMFLLAAIAQAGDTKIGKDQPAAAPTALDALKPMVGEWEFFDKDGKSQGLTRYVVSSGGSVLREVMFEGTEHEMTNMYHMDGASLVLTHYCAGGNQPRMRAKGVNGGVAEFKFDSITNLASKGESYMGELTLTMKDANTAVQQWTSFKDGKKNTWSFDMKRKM